MYHNVSVTVQIHNVSVTVQIHNYACMKNGQQQMKRSFHFC